MKPYSDATFWKYFKRNIVFQFVPFVLLSIVLFVGCFFAVRSYTIHNVSKIVLGNGASVQKILSDIDNIHFRMINNVYVMAIMQNDSFDIDNEEYKNNLIKTQEFMSDNINVSNYIDSIYVMNLDSNMIFSNYQYDSINAFFDRRWVELYSKDLSVPTTIRVDKGNTEYLSFIYPFNQYNENKGAIAINVKINEFESIFDGVGEAYYLFDINGKLLYSTDNVQADFVNQLNFTNLQAEQVTSKFCKGKIRSAYTFQNKRYILVIDVANFSYIRMSIIYQVLIVLYMILVFAVIYLLSKKYARYYYENISDVIDILSVYDTEGNVLEKANEFSYIKNNISQLIEKNDSNEIQLSKNVLQLKKAQLNALQMQINPHFILNTLNMVNLMLIREGDLHHDVLKVNENISKILSYVLAGDEYIIPISQEIQCAKDYLEIECLKKNGNFAVEWNVDESLLEIGVVKFILQPIIENCIEHGFERCKERNRCIIISVRRESKKIAFYVEDNGIGMNVDKLRELKQQLKTDEFPKNGHIAVLNVNQRIKLIYGNEYGLEIVKSDGNGTIIKMTIPVNQKLNYRRNNTNSE